MALCKTIEDREYSKFALNSDLEHAVRTIPDFKELLDYLSDSGTPIFVSSSTANFNEFQTVSAVPTTTPTLLFTYTVPVGKTLVMDLLKLGGDNVATFDIEIDSTIEGKGRIWHTSYKDKIEFNGLTLIAGQKIEVKVNHNRPSVGAFEARLLGSLS